MGPLLFRCPITSNIIDSRVETDEAALNPCRDDAMRVYCPHCKDWHQLPVSFAIIESAARKAS